MAGGELGEEVPLRTGKIKISQSIFCCTACCILSVKKLEHNDGSQNHQPFVCTTIRAYNSTTSSMISSVNFSACGCKISQNYRTAQTCICAELYQIVNYQHIWKVHIDRTVTSLQSVLQIHLFLSSVIFHVVQAALSLGTCHQPKAPYYIHLLQHYQSLFKPIKEQAGS